MQRVLRAFVCFMAAALTAAAVDDRGSTATQGADTWGRAALYMVPRP
jgi:hypothetical protein